MDPFFVPFVKTSCSLLSLFAFSLPLFFFSQTTFSANDNGSSSKCLHHEKLALLQLKHGFVIYRGADNSSSSKLDSWNQHTDCCFWEGITCHEATGNVIELDLSGRLNDRSSWIQGRIDSSLFHLGSLQKLDLSWNDFSHNPIPSELGRLTNLTHLDLSYSSFSGQIPLEVSTLTSLVSLNLSQRSKDQVELINPSLPILIQNLSNLRQLSLNKVKILGHGGEWAQTLSVALPNLYKLSLSFCGLGGPIDPSLFQLPFLSHLSLAGNNLSIVVPGFLGDSSTLRSLNLNNCSLYGKFPSSIFLQQNIQRLDISNNPNLIIDLLKFPQYSVLRYLFMGYTKIQRKLLDSMGNLKHLKELSLPNCNLSGPFPPSIVSLTQLESLDLSSNHLNSTIPFSLGDELQHLTFLYLHHNSLKGSVPPSLFSHSSLKYLLLSNNKFTGLLPDFHNGSSSALEVINLVGNKMRGPLPRSIFELTKLKVLSLSYNKFTGTIGLHMFRNVKNLVIFSLSNNRLSFIDSNDTSLLNLLSLQYLFLSSCNISKFPDILQKTKQLRSLDLSNNKIHGEIPSWIWKVGNWSLYKLELSNNFLESFEHPLPDFSLSKLKVVDLHSNRLRGSLPVLPPQVYFQDYSNNHFSFIMPTTINFSFGQFFFLSNNNVSGEIPLSVCNASSLEILDLSDNNFSGKIPTCLEEIGHSLKILNLQRNAFKGNIPEVFTKECSLRTLNLASNQLEGPIPKSLANCTTLEVLDFGDNILNGTFPFWFQNLSNLRIFILQSNKFNGPIAHSHTKNSVFPFLQIFDISSNAFTGIVPSNFFLNWKLMTGGGGLNLSSNSQIVKYQSNFTNKAYYQDSVIVTMKGLELKVVKILTALTSVDLSNNRFLGEIPNSVCNLKLLRVLNFSHNDFIGPLPASLENLTLLESLDLSRNKLSGNIPWQLTKLTFLAVLNLSQNLLYGIIPQSQQFLTFPNISFLGNTGLCGPPLTKRCVDTMAPTTPPSTFNAFGLDEDTKIDWKFMWIGSGVGFGFGFGAVFWILALWRKGSKKYMQLIDRMFIHYFQ